MPAVVSGATVIEAWSAGANLLLQAAGHTQTNLITEIESPCLEDAQWLKRFDPKTVGATDRLSVVAKVLFPDLPRQAGEARLDYLERNAALLRSARRRKALKSSWGSTYFERLLSIDGSENQIERAIRVLTSWEKRAETAIVAHLSSPRCDGLRPRGAPCLQYLEFLWRKGDVLDLVAVYRNHDFVNKALGNFIGLGRLLRFVANEGQKTPGRLVCHSVRAYADNVGQLTALVAR